MTITYSLDVSSSTFLGIHRLLLRWKGSIWKSVWPELLCWLTAYFGLSLWYRYLMDDEQRILFEDLCVFFNDHSDYIPITFMLGFYVSAVFSRWQEIFMNLGWIDSPALLIATIVRGTSEEARNIRRNIVRYLVLVQAMVYRDISACVKKRFPTMDHLVTAGIMTTNELREYDAIETEHIKYWTPIQWAFLLLRKARDKGMIDSDIIYIDMLEKMRQYRVNVLTLTLYDWVPIPLVYTQVVNLAVRAYFLIALLGRQHLFSVDRDLPGKGKIDLYVPIMSILQFLFYMGWIKVAEVLLNPLGEDDDDFETNWIIDRNLQVGLCIVDDCYGRVPGLEHDQFWAQSNPQLLYTAESAARPQNPMLGSCNDSSQQEDALLLPPARRRLMSTVAAPFPASSGQSNPAFQPDEPEAAPVPVHNHNPTRRISVVQNAYAEHSTVPGRLLETVKRKLSRAPSGKGTRANDPERHFDRGHPTRSSVQSVTSNDGSVQNFLWGGRAKVAPADAQKATATTIPTKPSSEGQQPLPTVDQQQRTAQSAATSPAGHHPSPPSACPSPLPAIREEEAEEGSGGPNKSASSASLDSVSSTVCSSMSGRSGDKSNQNQQNKEAKGGVD